MVKVKNPLKSMNFSDLYLQIFGFLISIGTLTMVAASSYFGFRPLEMLSFRSLDEGCDQVTSGIGNHCFSDYQLPMYLIGQSNPWINGHSYPPISMFPHYVFSSIRESFIGHEAAMYLWLLLVLISISYPIVLSLKSKKISHPFILGASLSLFTTAGLASLDRGTSAVFATPFLYLAAKEFLNNNPRKVLLWVTLASFVRPQFILLAFLLLALRAYKYFISSIGILISSILLGFAIWPGDRKLHFQSWLSMLTSYDQYASSSANWPINISAGKSVSKIFSFFEQKFPSYEIFSSLNSWSLANFKNIGIYLGILVFILFLFLGNKISKSIVVIISLLSPAFIPGVSWSYYLLVLIPISALLISANRAGEGMLDLDQELNPVAKVHILITVALVLSPFVLPYLFEPNKVSVYDSDYTALIAQFWGPILIILYTHLIGLGIWLGFNKSMNLKTIFAKNPVNPV
ncbi:MAG: hypothetical protein RIS61_262 [Actinomycetota bacterium]|jgi:hypothetical protein